METNGFFEDACDTNLIVQEPSFIDTKINMRDRRFGGDKLNFFEINWSITKTILTFLRALQFQLQHLGTHKTTRITANKTGDNETFLKRKKRNHIKCFFAQRAWSRER